MIRSKGGKSHVPGVPAKPEGGNGERWTFEGVTFERIARDRDVVEIIRGFDVNGNDRIDDGEFSAIVEAWTTAQIDDEVLLRAIDLLISQESISSTQE